MSNPLPQTDPPGEFTQHLQAVYSQHEADRQLIAQLKEELAKTQKELAELRAGRGIQIVIEGKRFVPAEAIHLVTDALNEQPGRTLKDELADSFVL